MNVDSIAATRTTKPIYYFQWANHGPRKVAKGNVGPNIGPTSETRLHFSSPAAANACTMAQTATLLGKSDVASDEAKRHKLTLVTRPEPGDLTDVCVLWDRPLPEKAAGVVLDYEVQDGRSGEETRAFLVSYAGLVHSASKRVFLYTNPLDAPTQRQTGIDASNAPDIAKAFDAIGIFLWSRNRQADIKSSYEAQKAQLGPLDPKKIYIVFELKDTSLEDASTVRNLAVRDGLAGVMLWRNTEKQGGACELPVNRKIACLATGRCTQPPRVP